MPNDTLTDAIRTDDAEAARQDTSKSLFRTLQWVIVGFGLGCLGGALAIAAYTLFGATRPSDCRAVACAETSDIATRLGWAVGSVAVVVLVAVLVHARLPGRLRARANWTLRLLIAGAGLGVVIGYRTSQFTVIRSRVDTYFRTWEQMWTITPAVWLLFVGAAVVALLLTPGLRTTGALGVAALVVGLVVAVVLSSTLASAAVRRGDDSQYVDASTAPDLGVVPRPAVLGKRSFERTLPYDRKATILPAGAGFVVKKAFGDDSGTPDVVAYGADGQQRWHFQRTGPVTGDGPATMFVAGIGVYADASVVVLSLYGEGGLYVGLDAVTGAQLWTSTDPALAGAINTNAADYKSPQFVARDDARWTAFDPRTGRQIWSIADPARCPAKTASEGRLPNLYDRHVYPIDTATAIGSVVDCSTRDRVDLRLVAVDPSSGAVTTDKTLTALEGITREDIQSWSAQAVPGADAVILRLSSKRQPMDAYVDYQTGLRTDYLGPSPLTPVGDGMFTVRDGEALRIFSGEAVPQCDVPLGTPGDVDYAFLRDQVVVLDDEARLLRVFDRAGCVEAGTAPIPAGYSGLLPVRGVTLLTKETGREADVTTSVIGFAPA